MVEQFKGLPGWGPVLPDGVGERSEGGRGGRPLMAHVGYAHVRPDMKEITFTTSPAILKILIS